MLARRDSTRQYIRLKDRKISDDLTCDKSTRRSVITLNQLPTRREVGGPSLISEPELPGSRYSDAPRTGHRRFAKMTAELIDKTGITESSTGVN